jgi:competence protein ComEC
VVLTVYPGTRVTHSQDGGSRGRLSISGSDRIAPGTPVEAAISGLHAGRGGVWYASALELRAGMAPVTGSLRAGVYRFLAGGIERSAGSGAALLKALLLGERTDLTLRTEELFRRAGVSHVLALSGMHLAIIAALVVTLVLPLFGRRVALVAGAVVALVYTIFIGGRPSLVRATLMVEITLLLMLFERPLHLVEVVAAAFLVHLLLQPAAIGEVSFQLSYLALLGIAVVAPGLIREIRPWVPTAVAAPVAAGVGAQVAGASVLFRTFGRIHPVGIVAGAVLGPIVALFMTAGIIGIAVSLIRLPVLVAISSSVLSFMATIIESIAWWFASVPALRGTSLALPVALVSVVCLGGGVVVERRRLLWTGRR